MVRWSPQSALLHVLSSHADKGPPLTGWAGTGARVRREGLSQGLGS